LGHDLDMASFSSIQNPKFAALPRYVSCVSNILSDCRDAASIPAKEHPAWPLDVPFCLPSGRSPSSTVQKN
jgi:hypothetical protein